MHRSSLLFSTDLLRDLTEYIITIGEILSMVRIRVGMYAQACALGIATTEIPTSA